MSTAEKVLANRGARSASAAEAGTVAVARITPPALNGAMARPRLLERLADAATPRWWVGGPPGSGKTTLAADHARRTGALVLWLRLDAGDEDPAAYFAHLRDAATSVGVACHALPRFSADRLGALEHYAREFFRALFVAIEDTVTVVHDDLHLLTGDGAVMGCVAVLLEEAPPTTRIVLTSREAPPACLARAVANSTLQVLPPDTLRLTADELRRLARAWEPGLDDARLIEVHRQTEGWLGGLVLARIAGNGHGICPPARATELLDVYFDNEVMGRRPAQERELLCCIAWLPRVTRALAATVTGDDRAWELLADFAHHALFVTAPVPGVGELVLHALLREHLQRYARHHLPPTQVRALQADSARALHDHGADAQAIELWLQTAEFDAAATAIATAAPTAFREARLHTLRGWLAALPETCRERDPWLNYWHAMCLLMNDPAAGRERMLVAYQGFKASGDTRAVLLSLSYLIGSYFMSYSSAHPMRRWVDEVGRMTRDFESLDDDARANAALSVWYGLFLVQPDHPDLPTWEERLHRLIRREVNPTVKLRMGMMLSKHYYYTGQFRRIWPLRALLEPETRDPRLSPYGALVWFLYSLPDCWSRGAFDEARAECRRALERAEACGIHLLDNHILLQTASACLLDGATDEAAALLERGPLAGNSTWHMEVWNLFLHKAWLACIAGRYVEAREHAATCLRAGIDMGGAAPQGFALAAIAWAALGSDERNDAARHVDRLDTLVARSTSALIGFHAELLHTHLFLATGDQEQALARLRRALATGRELGLVHFQIAIPAMLAPICQLALEHDIETRYVTELVAARRLESFPAPAYLEAWPWPVKIRALGGFQVLVDGAPLTVRGKAQSRTLSLLKAIVAFGGEGVSNATLCDSLWPEAEGDAAQHALESALYRLRKLIGKDAVLVHDGKVSLCRRRCWVDMLAFEELLAEPDPVPRARERAAALHRGAFLENEPDLSFAISTRNRLQALATRYL